MAISIDSTWQQYLDAAKDACARGDYQLGEEQLKHALDIAADQQASEREVAEIFHYTGWCLHAQQRLADALRSYRQALATYERSCGTTSAEAATVVQSIARVMADMGQLDQAMVMYERALGISLKQWGADSEYTKTVQSEMAAVVAQMPAAQPPAAAETQPQIAPNQAAAMTPDMVHTPQPSSQASLSASAQPQPQSQSPAMHAQAAHEEPAHPAIHAQPAPVEAAHPSTSKRRLPKGFDVDDEPEETAHRPAASWQPSVSRQSAHSQAPVIIDDLVHSREKFYGSLSVVIGVICYLLSFLFLIGFFVTPLVLLGAFISGGMHLGAMRSRGIKVTENQFPEIYEMVQEYSRRLNMQAPEAYIVCEDGILNAYARRFHRRDYIMISSDVAEIAYEQGPNELAFVVCHELGHVKRGHCKWAWLHIPSGLIPFYGNAYSRACEYTCDRIAQALVPEGALFGLVSLAAGTKLYKNINLKELYRQGENEWGFWTWFHEIESTHPNLINRIRAIGIADSIARRALES